jgi:hypothetical protein
MCRGADGDIGCTARRDRSAIRDRAAHTSDDVLQGNAARDTMHNRPRVVLPPGPLIAIPLIGYTSRTPSRNSFRDDATERISARQFLIFFDIKNPIAAQVRHAADRPRAASRLHHPPRPRKANVGKIQESRSGRTARVHKRDRIPTLEDAGRFVAMIHPSVRPDARDGVDSQTSLSLLIAIQ